MTGIDVVFLLLAIIGLIALLYFGAWCLFSVQRNHKEGHYILESDVEADDNEIFNKKQLYSGLGKLLLIDGQFK